MRRIADLIFIFVLSVWDGAAAKEVYSLGTDNGVEWLLTSRKLDIRQAYN